MSILFAILFPLPLIAVVGWLPVLLHGWRRGIFMNLVLFCVTQLAWIGIWYFGRTQ